MQLSSKGRYAVMAMADLARHSERLRAERAGAGDFAAKPVSIASVSDRQKISQTFLEQIFMQLRRGGLVISSRGPGGGYVLARDAGEISVLEVMQAVDEPVQMTRCSLEDGSLDEGSIHEMRGCVAGDRCLTHGLWQDLGEHIISFLRHTSLRDVIARPLEAMVFEATSDGEVVA